jgi:hypothetical protein
MFEFLVGTAALFFIMDFLFNDKDKKKNEGGK